MKILLSAVLAATLLSGCMSIPFDKEYDYQGKVWRGIVSRGLLDTQPPKKGSVSEADRKRIKFTDNDFAGRRNTVVTIRTGIIIGDIIAAVAAVPDNVDNHDIQSGAIVDVLLEKGPQTNYSANRVHRIVRLVCEAGDSDCRSRIRSEGKGINTLIEADAGDGSKYGTTYLRRMSKAEYEQYLKDR